MTNKHLSPGTRSPSNWGIIGIVGDEGRFRILCELDGEWVRSSPIKIIVDKNKFFEIPTKSGSNYILNSNLEIELAEDLLNSMLAIQVKIKDLLGSGWGGIEMDEEYFSQFDELVEGVVVDEDQSN